MRRNTTADVWAKVDRRGSDECWPWLGTILADGYAVIKLHGKMPKAHRVVYRLAIGPIPDGLQLDHLCHTDQCKLGKKCPHRRCVNPAHLKPATAKENTLRGSSFAAFNYHKTACHRGHPFDEITTGTLDHTVRRATLMTRQTPCIHRSANAVAAFVLISTDPGSDGFSGSSPVGVAQFIAP